MSDFEDIVVVEEEFGHLPTFDRKPKPQKIMESTGSVSAPPPEPSFDGAMLLNGAVESEKMKQATPPQEVPAPKSNSPPPPPPSRKETPPPVAKDPNVHKFGYNAPGFPVWCTIHESTRCPPPPPPPAPVGPPPPPGFNMGPPIPITIRKKPKKPVSSVPPPPQPRNNPYMPPPPPPGYMGPPPPPPQPIIIEEFPKVKPRHLRSRSSSISSIRSVSSVSSNSSDGEETLAEIKHCGQLTPSDFEMPPHNDYVVRLSAFSAVQEAFVTYHPATTFDFNEYSWIIRHGLTDRWFYPPDPDQLSKVKNLENAGLFPIQLGHVEQPRPARMRMPRIWCSSALTTKVDEDEDKEFDLVYYVVFHTEQSQQFRHPGPPVEGQSIYKVLRCGSREAALSESYYQAGNFGLSTVFCCAFKEGVDVMKAKSFRRVKDLENLAVPGKMQGRVKVFY